MPLPYQPALQRHVTVSELLPAAHGFNVTALLLQIVQGVQVAPSPKQPALHAHVTVLAVLPGRHELDMVAMGSQRPQSEHVTPLPQQPEFKLQLQLGLLVRLPEGQLAEMKALGVSHLHCVNISQFPQQPIMQEQAASSAVLPAAHIFDITVFLIYMFCIDCTQSRFRSSLCCTKMM